MSFYNMTDIERQLLINQYEILKKGSKTKVNYYSSQIEYLKEGSIYLFQANLLNDNSDLDKVISEKDSKLVMDILQLHDLLKINAKNHGISYGNLEFDFNNDNPYWSFAKKAIDSKLFPAYNNFRVINSHGTRTIKNYEKQINWWKKNGSKTIFTLKELNKILSY